MYKYTHARKKSLDKVDNSINVVQLILEDKVLTHLLSQLLRAHQAYTRSFFSGHHLIPIPSTKHKAQSGIHALPERSQQIASKNSALIVLRASHSHVLVHRFGPNRLDRIGR